MELTQTTGVEFTCTADADEGYALVFITPNDTTCLTSCYATPNPSCAFLDGVMCKCYHTGSEVSCTDDQHTSTTFISGTVGQEYIGTWKCRSTKQAAVAPAITLQTIGNL